MLTPGKTSYNRNARMQDNPQPILCEGVSLHSFLIEGDLDSIQALVDDNLNEGREDGVEYVALSAHAMVIFADLPTIRSVNPPYSQQGSIEEREAAVWILTAAVKRCNGVLIAQRLAWFVPYIFVSDGFALSAGREIFGFPKQWGWFNDWAERGNPTEFSVDTVAIPKYSPTARARRHRILDIKRVDRGLLDDFKSLWTNASGAFDFMSSLLKGRDDIILPSKTFLDGLLSDFRNLEVALVFLRQFPDVANGYHAAYRAIIEASAKITGGLPKVEFISDTFELTAENFDTHPIRSDLGLASGPIRVKLAFRIKLDFTFENGKEIWRAPINALPAPPITPDVKPRKVVVLGGGISSLTTVFELTTLPNWQEKYDITVYQMGWRLGGQGASGRDPNNHQRVLEHGLHVWFGFYENAFNLMWRCYKALGRPKSAPLHDVHAAFSRQNNFVFKELIDGEWIPWEIKFSEDPGFPGRPTDPRSPEISTSLPSPWSYLIRLLDSLSDLLIEQPLRDLLPNYEERKEEMVEEPGWWSTLTERIGDALEDQFSGLHANLLERALKLAKSVAAEASDRTPIDKMIVWSLRKFRGWLWSMFSAHLANNELRRLWIPLDLGLTSAIGILDNDIISKGFGSIDDRDLREWLSDHGGSPVAVQSAPLRALYDASFSYRGGDTEKPALAAGTGLLAAIRIVLSYKGSAVFKMNAGMGDVIFAPIYELLLRRGVKFKFFHKVMNLGLSEDNAAISKIEIGRQATLSVGEYDPLMIIKGLPCWPSEPLYDQLVEGKMLRDQKINLESFWTPWEDVEPLTLERGRDFDLVVLGINLGALPYICEELSKARTEWAQMFEHLGTTRTQAIQLWFDPALKETGWTRPSSVIGSYVQPFSSLTDFSQVLSRENWGEDAPRYLCYSSGVMKDDPIPIPHPGQHDFPMQALAEARATAASFLSTDAKPLWPAISSDAGALDLQKLHAPSSLTGTERLEAQYIRANVDPTERYVLCLPKTQQYRLKASTSGFSNLFLAGTWLDTGFRISSIESAVMSGKQAASALSGHPFFIVADNDSII